MASRRHERRELARRACGEKVKHASFEAANELASKTQMRAYRCIICGAWHIGHGNRPKTEFFGDERHRAEHARANALNTQRQREKAARQQAEAQKQAEAQVRKAIKAAAHEALVRVQRDASAAWRSYRHECDQWKPFPPQGGDIDNTNNETDNRDDNGK